MPSQNSELARPLIYKTIASPDWLPANSILDYVKDHCAPPSTLVTSVHGICIKDHKVLLIKHQLRGWDIPGGHIESNESAAEALRRELDEEAAIEIGSPSLMGYMRATISGPQPKTYRYPYPKSYMLTFVAHITELREFYGQYETIDRQLFTLEQIRQIPELEPNLCMIELALQAYDNS